MEVGRLEESTARSEVARYTMTPTQPFSYLVGALELERLRAARPASATPSACAASTTGSSPPAMPPTLVARFMTVADEREQRRLPDD